MEQWIYNADARYLYFGQNFLQIWKEVSAKKRKEVKIWNYEIMRVKNLFYLTHCFNIVLTKNLIIWL